MCPRCRGQIVNFDGDPSCLLCGWVKPDPIPAWVMAEYHERLGVTYGRGPERGSNSSSALGAYPDRARKRHRGPMSAGRSL